MNMNRWTVAAMSVGLVSIGLLQDATAGTVTTDGTVTTYRPGKNEGNIDFEHAKPMPMPANPLPPPSQEELLRQGKGARYPGPPAVSPGSEGPP